MKVTYIKHRKLACVEFDPKDERAKAIIIKLNLVAWDIAEQRENKVFFSVEDKDDFEGLKRFANHCKTHDFYY